MVRRRWPGLFIGTLSTIEAEALLPDGTIGLDEVVDLFETHFLRGLEPT